MIVVSALVCLLGACVVAKGAQLGARRLGLDVWQVLLWLGLAERRLEALPPRPGAARREAMHRRRPRTSLASSRTRRRTVHAH